LGDSGDAYERRLSGEDRDRMHGINWIKRNDHEKRKFRKTRNNSNSSFVLSTFRAFVMIFLVLLRN